MSTQTLTLTDFLLARIAEDEARLPRRASLDSAEQKRLRRECEAKRRIVELHKAWPVLVRQPPKFESGTAGDPDFLTVRMSQHMVWVTEQEYRDRFGVEPPTAPMIRALATIYADHPDYRDEWRA